MWGEPAPHAAVRHYFSKAEFTSLFISLATVTVTFGLVGAKMAEAQ